MLGELCQQAIAPMADVKRLMAGSSAGQSRASGPPPPLLGQAPYREVGGGLWRLATVLPEAWGTVPL